MIDWRKFFRGPRSESTIATPPLAMVCAGLLLAAVPTFGQVAGWAFALFVLAIGGRLFLNRPGNRLPSLPAKLLILALGIGGVAATFGSVGDVESGLSILFALVALKLFETRGARDFQVLTLLGYFLALCALFFSQTLLSCLYVAGVIVVLTAGLVCFYAGPGALLRSSRTAFVLLAQALPLVLLFFFLFPRNYGGFRLQFSRNLKAAAAMSNTMSPGTLASLALGDAVVFRANFPDGNIPAQASLYWRGGVFWEGNGLEWRMNSKLGMVSGGGQLSGPTVRQSIFLQPHGAQWLFALDRPFTHIPRAEYQAGGYLQSTRPIVNTFRYEVVSRPESRDTSIVRSHFLAATKEPGRISPRVRELVNGWRAVATTPRQIVDAALHHFHEANFSYSLEPGAYGENAFDEFLFERRIGFCEHYAGAFATLMRIAEVPARVIVGYHGGERNQRGNYVIVRQADAHAWCEVWLKDLGWLRVDPTEVIAPGRLNSGLANYLETQASEGADPDDAPSDAVVGWHDLLREARLVWDNLNYQWDLHVLNFDEENQRSFLALIGFAHAGWLELVTWIGLAMTLLLALLGLWIRRPRQAAADTGARQYARFCRRLAAAGLPRERWEGPLHFSERAATQFPAHAVALRKIGQLYARLRYAAQRPDVSQLHREVQALPKL